MIYHPSQAPSASEECRGCFFVPWKGHLAAAKEVI